MAPWTCLITLALTLSMVGVIWSMQALEYPLFASVGQAEFPASHARHNRALPLLVLLPSLLAELERGAADLEQALGCPAVGSARGGSHRCGGGDLNHCWPGSAACETRYSKIGSLSLTKGKHYGYST